MGFSGQGYLSGLPCPLPGDLPDSGIKPVSPESPALQADSVCVLVTQLCPTLCNPMDCSAPGSSVCGIFQARTLERDAISSSRVSSQPRDRTHVSCFGRWIFTTEPPGKLPNRYAAAKSLQSCLTLCDPIDGSPTGSAIPGILQARTLEWVAIAFSGNL